MMAWIARSRDWIHQDLRHAVRGLHRSPGFTTAAVVTLALGIGANTAMFGVIDQLMFRPLPYLRDPGAVHRVYLQTQYQGRVFTQSVFPYTRYRDLASESAVFAQTAAFTQQMLAVGSGNATVEREVAGVSSSLFAFFDVTPERGRFFTADEDVIPRGAAVAVLGHPFWKELGGGDVVGHSVRIGSVVTTIIGVAPDGFVGAADAQRPDVFIPITTFPAAIEDGSGMPYYTAYNWDWASMLVRRKAGINVRAANADLSRAFVRSRATQRATNLMLRPDSISRPRAIAGSPRMAGSPQAGLESRTMAWTAGVALIVLLVACANVTNLMLARVLRRRREFAVRRALGAGTRRLLIQSLIESLLLAGLGCIVGLILAQVTATALRRLVLPDGASSAVMADWRTLAAAILATLAAAVISALVPAVVTAGTQISGAFGGSLRGGSVQRSRARTALLVVQSALAVALLVGAGLFVRSLEHARGLPLGYDAESMLLVQLNDRGTRFDSTAFIAQRARMLAAAEAIPGIAAATRFNSRFFGTNTMRLFVPGIDSVELLGRFNFQLGTPGYFATLGTRILRGRAFTERDRDGAPLVTVVSASMARALWPERDPIGQCLHVGERSGRCTTVIGVAEDVVAGSLNEVQSLMYYLPYAQRWPNSGGGLYLRVRDGVSIEAMRETVRRTLQPLMPGQGYVTVRPFEELVDEQRRSWMLGARLFVALGGLALVVASIGTYGVVAYDVEQRTHELGVRAALGASTASIIALVVRKGVSSIAVGAAFGLAAAFAMARWVQSLLFGQSARDPFVYAGVALAILATALLASALPAVRASRVDPGRALRAE